MFRAEIIINYITINSTLDIKFYASEVCCATLKKIATNKGNTNACIRPTNISCK